MAINLAELSSDMKSAISAYTQYRLQRLWSHSTYLRYTSSIIIIIIIYSTME